MSSVPSSAVDVELASVQLAEVPLAAVPEEQAQLKKKQQPAAASGADAAPPAGASSAYLRFLHRLHTAWPDAPRLSVSFAHLSVLFPRPMHIAAVGSADAQKNAAAAAAGVTRSVPNLATTLGHWASLPLRLAARQLGGGDKPLCALNNASGHIAPGTMTLVLAPPGGGKSTLLKAVSGRLPSSSLHGSLLFNGSSQSELSARSVQVNRLCSYVGQLDLHFPTLTVSETLRFAAASSVPSADLLSPAALAADPELPALEAQRGDLLIQMLGLSESKDVVVGNDMLRGISGGQRKRVTLGEMLVGNSRLLALDEVSTGLDAAVTTAIFASLRDLCKVSGKSVVAALLQPTPETYASFDSLILLHEGRVMYQGPRSDVKRWLWQVCGVNVPVDVDEASFLVDFLTNPAAAIEAAKMVAQAQSFIESTRADRQAGRAPEAGGVAAHPELYDNYQTYTGAAQEQETRADLADAPVVRIHVDAADEPQPKKAPVPESTRQRSLEGRDSSDSASELEQQQLGAATKPTSSLTVPEPSSAAAGSRREKRLGGGKPVHSTAGAIPASDMNRVQSRYLQSRWHAHAEASHAAHQATAALESPLDPAHWSAYTRANFASSHPRPYATHLSLCFARQWLLFRRNVSVLIPRLCKALLIGLLYGLLFFQLSPSDFTEKLAVAMYGSLFAAMTNLSELPVASEARNVIAKQLEGGFYPSTPYYLAVLVMHLPLTLLESSVYATLIYWISNMAPDAGRFFFYILVCIVASNAMATFYRFVSYMTRNPDVAKQLDLPFVVLFIILNAFIIVYSKIPLWLRSWAFWIAPLSWGTRSLALNEFNGEEYSGPSPADPSRTLGDFYLDTFDLPTEFIWKWMGPVYLFGWYVFWSVICCIALSRVRAITPLGSEREHYEEADLDELKRKSKADGHAAEAPQLPSAGQDDDVLLDIDDAAPAKRSPAFQLSALPFTPVTLAWTDLSYSVPVANQSDRQLLSSVSGFSLPGTLTALMGASGAGKTTLMDCIAGRKTTGTLSADVRVNGRTVDIHSDAFQRLCGYVEQNDLHIGTATVEEALRFSARLRLPVSVSSAAQDQFVVEVMELMGLTPFRHSLIGDAAIAGLAPAQLKLVTIAVELVANPAVLFLDEPTSGLDAPAAWRVMSAIKRIALTGRTVLCTIHQPAARLFFLFDRLLLLQPGGRTIYFDEIGARGERLVSYFESAVHFQQTLPPGANPANWMLDVAADPHSGCADWAKQWIGSQANQTAAIPQLQKALQPPTGAAAAAVSAAAAAAPSVYPSWWVRYSAVQSRLLVSYWRNGPMNLTRAAVVLVIGLLVGLLYYKVRPSDYAGVNSFLAGVFMSLGFGPSLPASAALPTFFRQRAVVYRETTVGCYSILSHALALTVCEAVAMAVLMVIYILPLYFLMGLANNGQLFFRYYLVLYLCSQFYASISQLYLALLPNQVSASVVHSIVFSFLFVFGGLLVTASKMPAGWRWWYAMIPTPKAYVAVALGQLSCSDSAALEGGFGCGTVSVPTESQPVQVYDYVSGLMENSADSYGNQIGWLLLTIAVVKCVTVFGFRYVSHLKR